jgi:hypothetical protein
VKRIDTLETYIKFRTKLFHLTWKKRVKCKTSHGENEKKSEFWCPWSESLGFKCGALIMFKHLCLTEQQTLWKLDQKFIMTYPQTL